MTVICPNGHTSTTEDYCDECGAPMQPAPPAESQPSTERLAPAVAEPCPTCQTSRVAGDQFCENCGYDFEAGMPSVTSSQPPRTWELVVTADRAYYERFSADGVEFPPRYPPRSFRLEGEEIQIGRRSASRGVHPEIDLSGAPEDPGISRLHALLVRSDGGCYALVDLGSTNGTMLNGEKEPVAVKVPVPLADGDRIHLGAWTTMTIRAVPAGGTSHA